LAVGLECSYRASDWFISQHQLSGRQVIIGKSYKHLSISSSSSSSSGSVCVIIIIVIMTPSCQSAGTMPDFQTWINREWKVRLTGLVAHFSGSGGGYFVLDVCLL